MQPGTRKEREVWSAIQSLLDTGLVIDDLTGERVGSRLIEMQFNRGSNTDIFRYIRSWRFAFGQATPKAEFSPLKKSSDPITQAAIDLRDKIHSEAKHEISKIEEDFSQAKKLLEQDIALNQTELTAQKEQIIKLTSNLAAEELSRKSSDALAQQLQENLNHCELKNNLLEQHASEQKIFYAEQIKRADKERHEYQNHFDKVLTNLQQSYQQKIEQMKSLMEEQRHEAMLTIRQLQDTLLKSDKTNQTINSQLASVKSLSENLQEKLTNLQADNQRLTENHSELETLLLAKDQQLLTAHSQIINANQCNDHMVKVSQQKINQLESLLTMALAKDNRH